MAKPLTADIKPDRAALSLREYEAAGGYAGLRKALAMTPVQVQQAVTAAGLRGRGGAGFPTGMKWSFVPMGTGSAAVGAGGAGGAGTDGHRYFVVNADEKEPGTMKDRWLMEGNPHELIEGMLIAAYAVQATIAYIFLRREYTRCIKSITRAVTEAQDAHLAGKKVLGSGWNIEVRMHLSAGRYMCGEESGLLNALEGRRPTPRNKPPFPQVSGLWGKPTVVNNVETLCNVPHILREGADWYKALSAGRSTDAGTKIFGVSGKVKNPGLWEMPMGTTIRELLDLAGGMQDGHALRGLIPGGASTDFLSPAQLDVKLDFDSVAKAGSRLGTGTMVVLDDHTCPVGMVLSLEKFFARESCGFCTPCREGLPWVARILEALEQGKGEMHDLDVLEQHVPMLGPGRTFCALAPGAVEPLGSALKLFRDDFEQHVKQKRCPWR